MQRRPARGRTTRVITRLELSRLETVLLFVGYVVRVIGMETPGQPTMSFRLKPIVCCYLPIVPAIQAEVTKNQKK